MLCCFVDLRELKHITCRIEFDVLPEPSLYAEWLVTAFLIVSFVILGI